MTHRCKGKEFMTVMTALCLPTSSTNFRLGIQALSSSLSTGANSGAWHFMRKEGFEFQPNLRGNHIITTHCGSSHNKNEQPRPMSSELPPNQFCSTYYYLFNHLPIKQPSRSCTASSYSNPSTHSPNSKSKNIIQGCPSIVST